MEGKEIKPARNKKEMTTSITLKCPCCEKKLIDEYNLALHLGDSHFSNNVNAMFANLISNIQKEIERIEHEDMDGEKAVPLSAIDSKIKELENMPPPTNHPYPMVEAAARSVAFGILEGLKKEAKPSSSYAALIQFYKSALGHEYYK